jgi:CRP-like cAMP-binding protein
MKKAIIHYRDHIKLLLQCSLLDSMSPLQRNAFIKLCHKREFQKNEFLFHQGDPASGLYIVESGSVNLFIPDAESSQITIKPYQSFAEFSLTSEVKRSYSAQCLENSTLYGFFKSDFDVLKKRHPDIGIKLYEAIVQLGTQLLELSMDSIKKSQGLNEAIKHHFELYALQTEISPK